MTKILDAEPPTSEELWHSCIKLKGYLLHMTRNHNDADDLITDTWINASKGLHNFIPGSSLDAWLSRIARNLHLAKIKRYRKEVEDADGKLALTLVCQPEQEWHLVGMDIQAAFEKLPAIQCRVVKHAIEDGESYEYIAERLHVPIGTIRSRINRGRETLVVLLCDQIPEPVPEPKKNRGPITMLSLKWIDQFVQKLQ